MKKVKDMIDNHKKNPIKCDCGLYMQICLSPLSWVCECGNHVPLGKQRNNIIELLQKDI